MLGHYSSLAGSFRLALREYFRAYKLMPREPLVLLCIGICYINMVMNKRNADRGETAMQGFSFLYMYYK